MSHPQVSRSDVSQGPELDGFFNRLAASAFVMVALFAALPGEAQDAATFDAPASSVFDETFPYQASGVAMRQVVSDVARATGLIARIGEGVNGEQVTMRNEDGSVVEVLDEAASQAGATWWYDGAILHVEPAANITNALVNPRGLTRAFIYRELDALGLRNDRFPLWATADESVIRVTGPRGYVEQVVGLIATLIEVRNSRLGGSEETSFYIPRIYHGRTTGL